MNLIITALLFNFIICCWPKTNIINIPDPRKNSDCRDLSPPPPPRPRGDILFLVLLSV